MNRITPAETGRKSFKNGLTVTSTHISKSAKKWLKSWSEYHKFTVKSQVSANSMIFDIRRIPKDQNLLEADCEKLNQKCTKKFYTKLIS